MVNCEVGSVVKGGVVECGVVNCEVGSVVKSGVVW